MQTSNPLTPALFHVLLALADGDKHGYAIMKEVARLTQGGTHLSAGTLYGILRRLLEAGLVAEVATRPAPELDDERRRYYRLTPNGRKAAQAESARLEATLAIARAKKLTPKLRTL